MRVVGIRRNEHLILHLVPHPLFSNSSTIPPPQGVGTEWVSRKQSHWIDKEGITLNNNIISEDESGPDPLGSAKGDPFP